MGLLGTTSEKRYYGQSQTFTGNGSTLIFTLFTTAFEIQPEIENEFDVFINNIQISSSNYDYGISGAAQLRFTSTNVNTDVQESDGAPKNGLTILVRENTTAQAYGNYQHISLDDIISNFMIAYVGAEKIINRVRRPDVAFHAQRALQEFSYDTFKSTKSFEIKVPTTLVVPLPQDYVNYVKICWIEPSTGIERNLYPTRSSNNPRSILQDSNDNFLFDNDTGALLEKNDSTSWSSFKSNTTNRIDVNSDSHLDDLYEHQIGGRYGLTPERAQINGNYYIDELRGNIHFNSSISGKTVVIKYISDSLGTDSEMVVHKFAEEAMYKYLAYAILSTKLNTPQYLVNRLKKESFAAKRVAKLRLSNLKSEEIAQVMRNKSKRIKH
tara:strand:+ start:902 stop:2047 length:1146 start_codon:yes stop_codon:yes gene_type:complete